MTNYTKPQESVPRMRERLREMQTERQAGFLGAYTLSVAELVPGLLDRIELLERQAPELPAITLPWTGPAGQVEVDESGNILLDPNPDVLAAGADGVSLTADEATEAAAALLAAVAASREITGERPTITLRAPALSAPATDVPVGPWRWELQIAGRLGSWVVHRHSPLDAADTAEGLARLIADQHLEDRPADLAHTPWRVLVWRASEKTLTPSTAVALVTSFGMTLAAALRDSGIAGVLATGRGGRSILRPELARAARTGGGPTEFPRVNSTPADRCCARHDDAECPVDAPESCCDDCPALGGPLIPPMRLDELERICADSRDALALGAQALADVTSWNMEMPEPGYQVRYWTGVKEGEGLVGTARTPAVVYAGHTAVLWVREHPACIALTHIEVIDTPAGA